MDYQFQVMNQQQAEEIAYNWHYEGIYAFYDMESDPEDLAEFIDSEKRGESCYAVIENQTLIGFLSVSRVDTTTVEIGLGMKPELTGHGQGLSFVQACIEWTRKQHAPKTIMLSVATFNQRAVKVYEKAGFQPVETYIQETNGGHYPFLKMKKIFEK
ncbi:GNAT family N-acetyltransferase [Sporolactobacillus sp. Y61]|jgi:ribosomal-protein-alanine N-acetyltransferase|uniref:GNAT family N-acetyltransferase n=1 Tax=Sporolactobacillus sp. Y61 TaxID=3160863 RepID=A0AAU8ID01_9BACL